MSRTYENFQYVPGTNKRLATVDAIDSFLWFKRKKTVQVIKLNGQHYWRYVSTGRFAEGFNIEYLEAQHNAVALS